MTLDQFKASWRPALGWSAVGLFVAFGLTIIWLLLTGQTKLADATALIMALLGFATAPTTVYAAGRSWEKRGGVDATARPENFE